MLIHANDPMQDTQSIRPSVTFYQRKGNEAEGPQIFRKTHRTVFRSEAECMLILWNHTLAFAHVKPTWR
jgi:hypothetical protein